MQKNFRSNATSINVSVSLDDLPFCIDEILETNLFYSILYVILPKMLNIAINVKRWL